MEELSTFISTSHQLVSTTNSVCYISREGRLYYWDSNTPSEVSKLVVLPWPIQMVACSSRINAVLTQSGEVYTLDNFQAPVLTLLNLPSVATNVGINLSHVLVSTGTGELYKCHDSTVTLIDLPSACQEVFGHEWGVSFALTVDGSLYAWGSDNEGALGVGLNAPQFIGTPTKVLIDEPVVGVSLAMKYTLILTVSGRVYTCGFCRYLTDQDEYTPVHIPFPSPCRLITSGNYHGFIGLKNGDLYAWGIGSVGEFGQFYRTYNTPTLLQIDHKVASIACGSTHSIMVSTDDRVYFTGLFIKDEHVRDVLTEFTAVVL